MKGKFLHALAVMALVPAVSLAVPITPTDLDSVVPGLSVAGPMTDAFDSGLGSLTSEVFFDGSVYTYTFAVTPAIDNISEVNTGFPVAGFNGTAGWSFSDASAAGGSGGSGDFSISFDPDMTIDFTTEFGDGAGWDSEETITLFFQSTMPPGIGDYNMINAEVGSAQGFAPVVPEPATLVLALAGLPALWYGYRRRRRTA